MGCRFNYCLFLFPFREHFRLFSCSTWHQKSMLIFIHDWVRCVRNLHNWMTVKDSRWIAELSSIWWWRGATLSLEGINDTPQFPGEKWNSQRQSLPVPPQMVAAIVKDLHTGCYAIKSESARIFYMWPKLSGTSQRLSCSCGSGILGVRTEQLWGNA